MWEGTASECPLPWWASELGLGSVEGYPLLCEDTYGDWIEAAVLAHDQAARCIKVTYRGWAKRWDEDLPIGSRRIRLNRAPASQREAAPVELSRAVWLSVALQSEPRQLLLRPLPHTGAHGGSGEALERAPLQAQVQCAEGEASDALAERKGPGGSVGVNCAACGCLAPLRTLAHPSAAHAAVRASPPGCGELAGSGCAGPASAAEHGRPELVGCAETAASASACARSGECAERAPAAADGRSGGAAAAYMPAVRTEGSWLQLLREQILRPQPLQPPPAAESRAAPEAAAAGGAAPSAPAGCSGGAGEQAPPPPSAIRSLAPRAPSPPTAQLLSRLYAQQQPQEPAARLQPSRAEREGRPQQHAHQPAKVVRVHSAGSSGGESCASAGVPSAHAACVGVPPAAGPHGERPCAPAAGCAPAAPPSAAAPPQTGESSSRAAAEQLAAGPLEVRQARAPQGARAVAPAEAARAAVQPAPHWSAQLAAPAAVLARPEQPPERVPEGWALVSADGGVQPVSAAAFHDFVFGLAYPRPADDLPPGL